MKCDASILSRKPKTQATPTHVATSAKAESTMHHCLYKSYLDWWFWRRGEERMFYDSKISTPIIFLKLLHTWASFFPRFALHCYRYCYCCCCCYFIQKLYSYFPFISFPQYRSNCSCASIAKCSYTFPSKWFRFAQGSKLWCRWFHKCLIITNSFDLNLIMP